MRHLLQATLIVLVAAGASAAPGDRQAKEKPSARLAEKAKRLEAKLDGRHAAAAQPAKHKPAAAAHAQELAARKARAAARLEERRSRLAQVRARAGAGAAATPGGCAGDPFEDDDVAARASALPIGQCQRRNHCDDGRDWLTVAAERGRSYTVFTCARGVAGETYLKLYDPAHHLLQEDYDTPYCDYDEYGSAVTFTAAATGAHAIEVSEYYDDEFGPQREYEVCVLPGLFDQESCVADSFEPDDAAAQAAPIAASQCQARNHCDDSSDWLALEAVAGETYAVRACAAAGAGDPVLRILDPAGAAVAGDDDSADDQEICEYGALVVFTAAATGSYRIEVSEYDAVTGNGTEYQVCLDRIEPDAFEPDDAPAEAKPLAPGECQARDLLDDQTDWIAIDAVAGQSYEIATCNLGGKADTDLALYDPALVAIDADDDGGWCDEYASAISFTAGATGTYYLKVSHADEIAGPGRDYQVCLYAGSCVTPEASEPDNGALQARPIAVDSCELRTHCADEEDWLSFAAVAGEVYTVATCGLGPLADTEVEVLGPGLDSIDSDDDGGHCGPYSSSLRFTAVETGTHFLVVYDLDGAGEGREYQVCVSRSCTARDAFEPDDDPATAGAIAVGACQDHGMCGEDDEDWLRFDALPGHSYTIETCEVAAGNTYLELFDPDGAAIAEDDDTGTCDPHAGRVSFTARKAGSHRVRVTQYDYASGPGLEYRVCLAAAEAPVGTLLRRVVDSVRYLSLYPETPPSGDRYLDDFVSGGLDPDAAILGDESRGFVLYGLDSGLRSLRLVKATGRIRIGF